MSFLFTPAFSFMTGGFSWDGQVNYLIIGGGGGGNGTRVGKEEHSCSFLMHTKKLRTRQ